MNSQPHDLEVRLRGGDHSVLRVIDETYGPIIRRALRVGFHFRCSGEEEDVFSEALEKLWFARESLRGPIRPFLFRIARNCAFDRFRGNQGKLDERTGPVPVDDIDPAAERADSTDDDGNGNVCGLTREEKKLFGDLWDVIDHLSLLQRHIVWADADSSDGKAESKPLADDLQIKTERCRINRKRAYDRIREEMRKRGHNFPGA